MSRKNLMDKSGGLKSSGEMRSAGFLAQDKNPIPSSPSFSANEQTVELQQKKEPSKIELDHLDGSLETFHLLQSLTQAIGEAPDFHSALGVALRQVCEATQWEYGEAWLPSPDDAVLECSPAWYGKTKRLEQLRRTRETLTLPLNTGLPGRVWSSRQPVWMDDISARAEVDLDSARRIQVAGLKAGFGVPILGGASKTSPEENRVLAILTFFIAESGAADQRSLNLVAAVATQLGLAMGRKQLEAELRESQERDPAILEDQTRLICRFIPDGILTFVNDAYCCYFSKTREELLGRNLFQMIPEEYWEATRRHIANLSPENPAATREYKVIMPNGKLHWQQWLDRVVVDRQGQLVEFQSVGQDITERRLSEQESARLASIALLSPNPIVETDLSGEVRYLNPEAMRLFPDLQDKGLEHPFLTGVLSMMTVLQHNDSFRREVKIGEVYYEQVLHYVPEIECLRIYAFDITERKQIEEQLIHNAFYDRLTGLANRALFMDRLRQAARRAEQWRRRNPSGQPYLFAVLFLNLNRFKVVNDSLGNQMGDQLLQSFARRLQTCLRSTDTVARLGGDEFAILLEGIQGVSDATRVADAIHQALAAPFDLGKNEVFVTVSIGIAVNTISDAEETTGDDILQPEDLLRNADIAMYRAKAQGKTYYEVFDAAMHSQAVNRLQMETDLRRAIERQEFQVYYQPIVSLSTGRICGFEALIRWQHPQRGLVSPSEFIPIAEETGLITPIGWWTLQEACHQLSIWQKEFPASKPLTINVNLSCKQFTQPDLVQKIDQILQETQLKVGSLKLEITESVVMENPDLVKEVLLQLKEKKINLCIDDFGTGYSSLSRLHHFPISTLKIDRSFVSRIGALGENSEIVQAIVTLAQTLSMDVVAEGIEVSEQVDPLIALQCEYGQGYYFSKPLDSKAAGELLRTQWLQRDRQKR